MANPLALEQSQHRLEADLKAAIARHADGKPHELDLSFGERGTPEVGALSDLHDGVEIEVYRLIDAFHEDPVVQESGMRVAHLTAIDSDGDGEASLRLRYRYADDSDPRTPSDRLADLTPDEANLALAADAATRDGIADTDLVDSNLLDSDIVDEDTDLGDFDLADADPDADGADLTGDDADDEDDA